MNRKRWIAYLNKTLVFRGAVLTVLIIGGIIFLKRSGFLGNLQVNNRNDRIFSSQIQNLPDAKKSETIVLKNGDNFTMEAKPVRKIIKGENVRLLSYNGSIPGPLIKVPQGAEIILTLKNETDADTTLHSHGIRLENRFDGVPEVTQEPVKPGKSFTYKLKFPDAGVYWYHPHFREDYAQELGLYGNFLVIPEASDYWAEVDREEAIFIDDMLLENGQIAAFNRSTVDHTLMGRFGNTMLVNGSDAYRLSVNQGERVRFYITNAANTRVFNLSLPGARLKLVGGDNGKVEQEEWVESVVIGPSERAVLEVWFDEEGEYLLTHKTPDRSVALGTVVVQPGQVTTSYFLVPRRNDDLINSLSRLRPLFEKVPDKNIVLTMQMGTAGVQSGQADGGQGIHMMGNGQMMQNSQMSMGAVQKIEWEDDMGMMNAQSTTDTLEWKIIDALTKKENMDIVWQFNRGDVVKIKIVNDDKSMHPMQHPIHIHGQRFLVISTNGRANPNLGWKDTALIQTGDTVELLVQMDNPGRWLIHCHIPEHMEAGMQAAFQVN